MPLLRTVNLNPVAAILPNPPAPAGAPPQAPAQGDHVFGDLIGVLQTAFEEIFGGGPGLNGRITAYNTTLGALWIGFGAVDLGHGPNQPVVQRQGAPEPDEHAHMFGGYARILQWRMAEIVDTGFAAGLPTRRIGGATNLWKRQVRNAVEDLLARAVDETALRAYIQAPGVIRQAAPANVRHPAIGLVQARVIANQLQGPNKNAALAVIARWSMALNTVMGLIDRLDGPTRKFDLLLNGWVPDN